MSAPTTDTSLNGLCCPSCRYDLGGLRHNICPECGSAFDPAAIRFLLESRRGQFQPLRVLRAAALLFLIFVYFLSPGLFNGLAYAHNQCVVISDRKALICCVLASLVILVVSFACGRPRPGARYLVLPIVPLIGFTDFRLLTYPTYLMMVTFVAVLGAFAFWRDPRGSARVLAFVITSLGSLLYVAVAVPACLDLIAGRHWSPWANPLAHRPGNVIALSNAQILSLCIWILPVFVSFIVLLFRSWCQEIHAHRRCIAL